MMTIAMRGLASFALLFFLAALVTNGLFACSSRGARGPAGAGGLSGLGGAPGSGGLPGSGGVALTGGAPGTGGAVGVGGMPGSGGSSVAAGAFGTGGGSSTGGTITGGTIGTGGVDVTGGALVAGGSITTGGVIGAGGAESCMPGTALTGGKQYCEGSQGSVGNGYSYMLWSNSSSPCMTVYGVDAAFNVTWTQVGNMLAMAGLELDATQTAGQLGALSSDFAFTKTGSAGGSAYIGLYGWSVDPTREFYIIEDWLGAHPVPGSKAGEITVDGGRYDVYTNPITSGSTPFGSRTYVQYFSVRQTPRQCGHTSISEHFSQWQGLGLELGRIYEAMVLVEGMGSSCTVDFMLATVVVK
jgi:endo-1,4-beta-xylanase